MAGHLYGYTTQSTAAAAAAPSEAYYPSSLFLSQASSDAYSRTASHLASLASWSSAVAAAAAANTVDDTAVSGVKRSSEALYQQTVLGNMTGHEAWYSTDALTKRLRYENASNLPIYPQRPGEKDCAHYMLTRTCKFGDSCKFDHPIWVPEGGIPEWKEVPPVTSESLPERPGELDCPYFLKTQRCKFGLRCRFNHPKSALDNGGASALPDRPSETPCAFYLKTGTCKFGSTCKFDHPKDIQLPLAVLENGSNPYEAATSVTPALLYNSKDLPIRPGEADCPFYLKTGSCKYGITCRYSHPDRNSIIPPAVLGHALMASPAAALNLGVVNPVASLYQTIDPRLAQAAAVGITPNVYPQRPGQMECDFYMKTGECKFGQQCKYNHPIDRSAPTLAAMQAQQQSVKLTLAGLPRREGSIICPYYLKTGTCKYGPTCKFDHPPPGEVMAKGSTQETPGEEAKEEDESE